MQATRSDDPSYSTEQLWTHTHLNETQSEQNCTVGTFSESVNLREDIEPSKFAIEKKNTKTVTCAIMSS